MNIISTLKKMLIGEYLTEFPMNEHMMSALTAGFDGDYASAVKYIDEAIDETESFDEEKSLVYSLKSAALIHLDRNEEALSAINLAIKCDPINEFNWATKGDILHDLGRQQESLKAYEKSLESLSSDHEEKNTDSILTRADVLSHLGRHEESLKEYKRAENIEPYSIDAIFGQANELLDLKKHKESLKACERGLKIDCNDPDLVIHKGVVKLELDLLEDSLKCFEKAILLDPTDDLAWFNKALVLSKLNQKEDALDALTVAVGIDSENKKYLEEKDLDNIRNEERFTRLMKQSL